MDEQLKKELKEMIDDHTLKARRETAQLVIDMVNEQLRDNGTNAKFTVEVQKRGVWVNSEIANWDTHFSIMNTCGEIIVD